MPDTRMIGGNKEVMNVKYDINAKAATSATLGQKELLPMLQSLLAERFKLKTHMEAREMPLSDLVLARSDGRLGPALKPSKSDCSNMEELNAKRAEVGGQGRFRVAHAEDRVSSSHARSRRPCRRPANISMHGDGQEMKTLADVLSQFTGKYVRDKTGLTGLYDFDIRLDIQLLMSLVQKMGVNVPAGALANIPQADGSSLMTALNEQLGLKLESRAGPGTSCLDSVEAPPGLSPRSVRNASAYTPVESRMVALHSARKSEPGPSTQLTLGQDSASFDPQCDKVSLPIMKLVCIAVAALLTTIMAGSAGAQGRGGIPVPALPDQPWEYQTANAKIRVRVLTPGLENPWSLEFLPDASILITERNGRLRHFKDGKLSGPVAGLPPVVSDNFISGLHDIKLHPNFAQNRCLWVYNKGDAPLQHPASLLAGRGSAAAVAAAAVRWRRARNARPPVWFSMAPHTAKSRTS